LFGLAGSVGGGRLLDHLEALGLSIFLHVLAGRGSRHLVRRQAIARLEILAVAAECTKGCLRRRRLGNRRVELGDPLRQVRALGIEERRVGSPGRGRAGKPGIAPRGVQVGRSRLRIGLQ